MRYFVQIKGRTFKVDLGPEGTLIDGEPVHTDLAHVEGTDVRHLLMDGSSHRFVARREADGTWDLHLRGRRLQAKAVDERTHTIQEMTGAGAGPVGPKPVRAPMPGLVVKLEVEEGDRVGPGQGVVIVEAMKMENELSVEAHAIVGKIHVAPGDTVQKDDLLIELEPVEAAVDESPDQAGAE
jgi:pyruvate carboxylase subunit B